MKSTKISLLLLTPFSLFAAGTHTADIVVYGGTSAAIIAAVQAKKMGKTVVVVSPDKHLGGLSSGGLGWTDSGKKEVIGGLSRDFYHRIWLHYDNSENWRWQKKSEYGNQGQGAPAIDGAERTMWIFEPHAAEKVFEGYVTEFGLNVLRDEWLDRANGVAREGNRISSIKTLSGKTFAGSMFIDATYEGDLMAAAGVSYMVGRESNSAHNETLNGSQAGHARSHQFAGKIDPYVIEGDPSSGLLPRIQDSVPGKDGEGDKLVQAYNFRMCLTQHPENRVPFPKPEGYDPKQYALLARVLQKGSTHVFGKFDPIPNLKTDTNNHGSFSTDNIGMNWDYPEASYERRREIIAEHRTYQQGYLYFLANDPSVPEAIRTRYATWGLAADEFKDNGNWPHQIYVREARRMVSDVVVNENHLRRKIPTPRPVGMGSYNMDSHHVRRYVARDADGRAYVRNEGDVQINPGGPYPIDFGAIVPKKSECANLLVPVCVSCTHIAYGSIRMEPVFMILAQSAATTAVMALEGKLAVQDVPYEKLSERLRQDGQVLEFIAPPKAPKTSAAPAPGKRQPLPGITVDDASATLTGNWSESTSVPGFVGIGYRHDSNARNGAATSRFAAQLPKAGRYEVFVAIVPNENRASKAAVTVEHAKGRSELKADLRSGPASNLVSLGTFDFDSATPAAVTLSNSGADGFVVIDAVNWQER